MVCAIALGLLGGGCVRGGSDAVPQRSAPPLAPPSALPGVTDTSPPAATPAPPAQVLAGSPDVHTAALGRALMHRY